VVEKIWNFDFGAILWISPRLRTFLELFFKFQGSNGEIRDCGLIFEKHRGFVAKLPGIIVFEIIFVRKKTWTRSTVDRGGAAESAVARLPERGAQALWLTGGCREGRRRERGTRRCRRCPHRRRGGGEAVGRWWQSGGDEGTRWGRASARERRKRGWCGVRRDEAWLGAFYRCRGGAVWPNGGGERPVAVERHDGGGGGRFRMGSDKE
jgi:hypothetical protein